MIKNVLKFSICQILKYFFKMFFFSRCIPAVGVCVYERVYGGIQTGDL